LDLFALPFLFLPAVVKAIATACFCGLPSLRNMRILELIALLLFPFLKGIVYALQLQSGPQFLLRIAHPILLKYLQNHFIIFIMKLPF
jgi:hypothetical protein